MKRIYIEGNLRVNESFKLDKQNLHYLKTVLRFKDNDLLNVFNAKDGEFKAIFSGDGVFVQELIKKANKQKSKYLAFSLIKAENLKLIIESSVQMGVTHIQPLITHHSVSKSINLEKIENYIKDATQQCERLDLVKCFKPLNLKDLFANEAFKDVYWFSAIERYNSTKIHSSLFENKNNVGFIVGCEGGFDLSEKNILIQQTTPISLGENILKSQSAIIACLAHTL